MSTESTEPAGSRESVGPGSAERTESAALEATELTVHYPNAPEPALDSVTMVVPRGAFYAVLGPNGSGKSTLLRALLGIVSHVTGRAHVSGRPISNWDRRALAREAGVVTQSESLAFPITVRELVAMGRYPYLGALQSETPTDREAISEAMRMCDIELLAHRFLSTLSGGEIQRTRVARALAQEPKILVLDEPTASLDVRHEMEILELLRASADRGMTIFLITHHLNLAARFADRLLLLDRGKVAAEGEPRDVLQEETLRRVYGWPISVSDDPATGVPHITPLSTASHPKPHAPKASQ
jgi:iron complex transport system ATP-binding protein